MLQTTKSLSFPQIFIVQKVSHLDFLNAQIALVELVRLDDERHALDDLEVLALKSRALGGVVRHEADARQAEIGKDLCANAVVAEVGREAQFDVRLDGIRAFVL